MEVGESVESQQEETSFYRRVVFDGEGCEGSELDSELIEDCLEGIQRVVCCSSGKRSGMVVGMTMKDESEGSGLSIERDEGGHGLLAGKFDKGRKSGVEGEGS